MLGAEHVAAQTRAAARSGPVGCSRISPAHPSLWSFDADRT